MLSVFRARDFDEALEIAIDSEFALTGGVSPATRATSSARGGSFASATSTSTARRPAPLSAASPSAVCGCRGIGDKAGGPDYLLQFLEPRTISENTMRRGFAPEGIPFDAMRAQ